MHFAESFKEIIFTINEKNFASYCLEVFKYQYSQCPVYHTYCNLLDRNPNNVKRISQIPFLPIEFFKNHAVKSGTWDEEKVFKSSGTTKSGRSQHFIKDLNFYHRLTRKTFEDYFGQLETVQILALLPSYLEMGDSSLIAMIDAFLTKSAPNSGYFHDNFDDLTQESGPYSPKKLLFGVSYALLDLSERYKKPLQNIKIMETGGMKGRRKEMTRRELHQNLRKTFKIDDIFSEYGMTELMSQAYGKNGEFRFPEWVKVLIRDINDPFSYLNNGKTGGINVIDLGNIDSCAFIETKDLGKAQNRVFEVLGRFDNSDIRGCNLMF